MRVSLVACLVALFATVARADDQSPAPRVDFDWGQMVGEGPSGYDKALEDGDAEVVASTRYRRSSRGRLRRALRSYEKAIALDPKRPEAYYRAAQTIYAHYITDQARPSPLMTEKALRYWQTFEKLAPLDPRIPDVLFQKSLALTKQVTESSFRKAVAIYDRLLSLSSPRAIDPNTISIYLGNKAELHMMLGELDKAIEDYYLAIDYGSRSWLGYGLAVALDRDGQEAKARQIMRTNVLSDKNMSRLSTSGTFFVPAGEKHYYLALGYEVLGDYRRAVRHYRAFIDSGAHPRFHPRAREHIRRLEPKVKSSPRLRNRPNPPPVFPY
jgi:tetratricopeptide (TPR) repeat protein